MEKKSTTIILTVSVRVTGTDKDLDKVCDNLEGAIIAAYNNGNITEGTKAELDAEPTVDTEVDEEEEEEEGE